MALPRDLLERLVKSNAFDFEVSGDADPVNLTTHEQKLLFRNGIIFSNYMIVLKGKLVRHIGVFDG